MISVAFAETDVSEKNAQLIQAAKDNNFAAVQTLLAGGADVNAKRTTDGVTALMWAALNGNTEIVKLLLEKGADINAKSNDGLTALVAARSSGHKDIVQLLDKTAAPAGLAQKNAPEKSAQLIQAAKDSNLPAVQTENKEDKFPLSNAANQGNIEKVKELIAKRYNVNTQDDVNWTPLHRALFMGHKEIVKLLIANGANVNAKNNIGVIPIMLAVMRDYNDIVELLIKNGAQKTIYVAAAQGDVESVKAFLKKDPNLINAPASNDGWSALHWAAYMNRLDVIKVLIENGADVNIRERIYNVTPLHRAVCKGHLDAAKFLIDKGADVKIKFKNGGTMLHSPGTFETAKLLIDNGADVNAKDDHGITPLHSIAVKDNLNTVQKVLFEKNGGTVNTYKTDFEKYQDAAEKVTTEIAELLIKNGADVNAKDEKGNTPLSNAKAANNKALIELLEKYNATAASGMPPAEQTKQPPAAQTSDLSLDIDCGILYCGWDEKTDVLDIFIADPKLHTKINLTRGRLTTEGWSRPWEPVGSPDGQTVVLRQFKRLEDGKKYETKIWLLAIKDQNLQQVPGNFGFVSGFAWSPDSSSFAFSNDNEIIVCDRKTVKTKTVATGGSNPLWSPDGRWLAFIQKDGNTQTLQLVSLQNDEKKSVTSGFDTPNICWSPDSQKLAIVKNSQLSIVLLNGEIQNLNYQASDVSSWSHNGEYIAFETRLPTKKRCLWILSLADKKTSQVDISGDNSNGVWGPQSDLLAFWNMMGNDATLMAVGPDGKNPQRVDLPHSSGFMRPSWLFVRQAKQGYQDENKIEKPATNELSSPNNITFKSAEPAPEAFDAWCLEGMTPIGDANAAFWSVVIQPDGQECDRRDYPISVTNRYYKSYFKPGSSGFNPRVFYKEYIRFSIRADKGNVVFQQSDIANFKFQFFRKNAAGQINWNPFKTIDAVIEP